MPRIRISGPPTRYGGAELEGTTAIRVPISGEPGGDFMDRLMEAPALAAVRTVETDPDDPPAIILRIHDTAADDISLVMAEFEGLLEQLSEEMTTEEQSLPGEKEAEVRRREEGQDLAVDRDLDDWWRQRRA